MESYLPSKDDIASFRAWLSKIPYLSQDVDDSVISAFIQGSKGRMEKAKSAFDQFHIVRQKHPDLFSSADPEDPDVIKNRKAGFFALSPNLTSDGCAVAMIGLTNPDPALFSMTAYHRTIHMWVIMIMLDPKFRLKFGEKWNGRIKIILDTKLNTMTHYAYTPTQLKGLVEYMSSSLPVRMAGIHIINVSPLAERFYNLLKTFLKKKLANRINLHSNADAILSIFEKDVLVKDFGGSLGTGHEINEEMMDGARAFRKELLAWEEKLDKLEKLRPRNQEDIIVGSFKKLEVD